MPENETTETLADENAEQPQGSETDWKAEARKWERYAKENKAAKDELDALKASQMTEQERLVRRAEEAEQKLAEATARIQHANDVAEVSAKSGVPASLLEFCADRDAMEAFAKEYASAAKPTHSAPPAPMSRRVGGAKVSSVSDNAEAFAELLEGIL